MATRSLSVSAMYYKVTARLREATARDFLRKLTDGSVATQKPDGYEIVASMERAVVAASGLIEWSEVCYCRSPLDHERSTVYDFHFDELTTEAIDGYEKYEGRPFMPHLEELAARA